MKGHGTWWGTRWTNLLWLITVSIQKIATLGKVILEYLTKKIQFQNSQISKHAHLQKCTKHNYLTPKAKMCTGMQKLWFEKSLLSQSKVRAERETLTVYSQHSTAFVAFYRGSHRLIHLNKPNGTSHFREQSYFTAACLVKASDLSSDLLPFFRKFYVRIVYLPSQNHQREKWNGGR